MTQDERFERLRQACAHGIAATGSCPFWLLWVRTTGGQTFLQHTQLQQLENTLKQLVRAQLQNAIEHLYVLHGAHFWDISPARVHVYTWPFCGEPQKSPAEHPWNIWLYTPNSEPTVH